MWLVANQYFFYPTYTRSPFRYLGTSPRSSWSRSLFNLISPTQWRTTKFFSCSLCSAVLLVISYFEPIKLPNFRWVRIFGESISSHCQESLWHPLLILDRQQSENSHRPEFRIIDHWFFSGAKEQKLKSSKFLNPIGPLSLPLL